MKLRSYSYEQSQITLPRVESSCCPCNVCATGLYIICCYSFCLYNSSTKKLLEEGTSDALFIALGQFFAAALLAGFALIINMSFGFGGKANCAIQNGQRSHILLSALACAFGFLLLWAAFAELRASLAITFLMTEPCFTAQLNVACIQRRVSCSSWKALIIIVIGATVATYALHTEVTLAGMICLIGANLLFAVRGVLAKQLNRVLRMEPMAILYHTCAVGCVMLLSFAVLRESLLWWKRDTKWTSVAELYEWSMRLLQIRILLLLNMGSFAIFVLCSCLLQIRVNEEVYSTGTTFQYLLGILWCALTLETVATPVVACGVAIATVGSLRYSIVTHRTSAAEAIIRRSVSDLDLSAVSAAHTRMATYRSNEHRSWCPSLANPFSSTSFLYTTSKSAVSTPIAGGSPCEIERSESGCVGEDGGRGDDVPV